jgi:hypothetical protein
MNIPTMFHEVWWKKWKKNLNPPFFLFPWQLWQSLSYRFQFFFALLLCYGNSSYSSFSFFLPSKVCPTHFSKMLWSNFMKLCRIIICHVKLFFVSMATAAKFVQPIPIFLAYSCGCCSYQVSLISVWRVTCYDNFCVFHFF